MKFYDIAIIGGGASGLAAAISAANTDSSRSIVILERLPRIGKKILATGNGRCNFTNRNIDKSCYYGSCSNLSSIGTDYNIENFFASLGVYSYADNEGRVYPLSNTASSVLDGLRLKIADFQNIDIICDFNVKEIKKDKDFIISSDTDYVTAKAVIAAGGGMSQAALGSDGSVMKMLKSLNIHISPLSPALTSFKVNPDAVKALKGIRVNADVSVYSGTSLLGNEKGEVQFADNTISGICIFNLSCLCNEKRDLSLNIDLLPDNNYTEVVTILSELKRIRSDSMLEDYLSGLFHKRIGIAILKSCIDMPLTEKTASLSNKYIKKIAEKIKSWTFTINSLSGFEKSQVTSGGVIFSEIDNKLRSKKVKGLYMCGELLDITGKCGGYNLDFAFSSGILAGQTCAEDLK